MPEPDPKFRWMAFASSHELDDLDARTRSRLRTQTRTLLFCLLAIVYQLVVVTMYGNPVLILLPTITTAVLLVGWLHARYQQTVLHAIGWYRENGQEQEPPAIKIHLTEVERHEWPEASPDLFHFSFQLDVPNVSVDLNAVPMLVPGDEEDFYNVLVNLARMLVANPAAPLEWEFVVPDMPGIGIAAGRYLFNSSTRRVTLLPGPWDADEREPPT